MRKIGFTLDGDHVGLFRTKQYKRCLQTINESRLEMAHKTKLLHIAG